MRYEPVPSRVPADAAETLAELLGRHGLITQVYKTRGHDMHPCVKVASCQRGGPPIVRYVYAAPGRKRWHFWWDDAETQIAPLESIAEAAETVARVMCFTR